MFLWKVDLILCSSPSALPFLLTAVFGMGVPSITRCQKAICRTGIRRSRGIVHGIGVWEDVCDGPVGGYSGFGSTM